MVVIYKQCHFDWRTKIVLKRIYKMNCIISTERIIYTIIQVLYSCYPKTFEFSKKPWTLTRPVNIYPPNPYTIETMLQITHDRFDLNLSIFSLQSGMVRTEGKQMLSVTFLSTVSDNLSVLIYIQHQEVLPVAEYLISENENDPDESSCHDKHMWYLRNLLLILHHPFISNLSD